MASSVAVLALSRLELTMGMETITRMAMMATLRLSGKGCNTVSVKKRGVPPLKVSFNQMASYSWNMGR